MNNIMSEQLVFRAKTAAVNLSFIGTSFSEVALALNGTFGNFPIQLDRFSHEQILVGMAAAAGDGKAPYVALLDALRKYDGIEVLLGE